jgi:type II secretory pathway component PulK
MRRRGVVLVAVLVVTVLATMVAAGLMFYMRSEVAASAAQVRGEQAYQASLSGLKMAMAVVTSSGTDMTVWYDNPEFFQNQLVADDGVNRWYFTVYADDGSDVGVTRYGVTDESSKVNLNNAPAETLLALNPNMTATLVDCLKDYIEPGTEPRPEGAKQEYYDTLQHPYTIAGAPLTTMDELLMVKGFSAQVLYGEDANQNGILDPNEDDGDDSFPPDNRDGKLDRGLKGVATVYTSEPNTDSSGRARTNLNGNALPTSGSGLSAQALQYILAYRAEGNTFTHPSQLLEMTYTMKSNFTIQSAGSSTGTGGGGGGTTIPAGTVVNFGVTTSNIATILDKFTVASDPKKPLIGLVNINTASAEVLAALPGMDANLAAQIVDVRKDLDPTVKKSIAWLVTQDVLKADAFKAVAPYLTARSFQYSIKCIGYGWPCGRYRILEAVLDLSSGTPRIAYLRDITQLGLPFALDPDALQGTL